MGSQPIRIQLGKILQENLAGYSGRKILQKNLAGNSAGNLVENLVGNLVGKYSFLKPILNGFSHITHQIEA